MNHIHGKGKWVSNGGQAIAVVCDCNGTNELTDDDDLNGNRINTGYVTGTNNRLLEDGTFEDSISVAA